MKKYFLLLLFITLNLNSFSQEVLLEIENDKITLDEFSHIFNKNNDNEKIDKEYLDEYIELFINFKLKVKEAKNLGFDTVATFIDELNGYRKQLAKPYLRDDNFNDELFDEALDRIQFDINANHILININDENNDEALNKINDIRREIINGNISFEDAAVKYSDDKSAKENKGNLGYFTAFMMVYDFETAAYQTDIGDVSMPVKTKYGYHLIKVHDKRAAVGQVKVSHIMFKTGKGADKLMINKAKEKIDRVSKLLENGEDFTDVAERFSEDRSTAVKGGNLPIFGVGKMVPEFENVAFSLKNVNDISDPFLTDYGWHVIKLIEKKPIGSFSDVESELKKMVEKDSRSELSQQALFEKLRSTYKIKNKPSVYSAFRKNSAFAISKGNYINTFENKSTLFTIDQLVFSVNDFVNYIKENQVLGSDIDQMYIDFVNKQLLDYEDSMLEEKYPEYKALLNEYREGILLFDLTNQKVWKKAVEDTVGLNTFFIKNQSSYEWDERVNATIYTCVDLVTAKEVKRNIYKKHRNKITDKEILTKINSNEPLSLKIDSKNFVREENKYIDNIDWTVGISNDIVLQDGTYVLIDIHQILPPGPKMLEETRGKVISDYQNALENEWITILKSKYSIEINTELLYSLVK